jgi:diacylglycerol kinase family enzyme
MPTSRSVIVVLNAAAGSARGISDIEGQIVDLFRAVAVDAEVVTLRAGQNPTDTAREASEHVDVVVAAGGDGTVSGVAAGLVGGRAALGVIPLGTLNHFAKDLGVPFDLAEAVGVVAAGHLVRVDVGTVNDRIFVNNSSIGIYPDIVQERDALQRGGRRKWPAFAIATARVLRRHDGVTVTIEVNGRVHRWRTPFVFVGNNEYEIDGRQIGGRTSLHSGRLFVYLAPRARVRDLPLLMVNALLGRAGESPAFEIVATTELTLRTAPDEPIRVAMDGEVETLTTPLQFHIRAGALSVVVPPR